MKSRALLTVVVIAALVLLLAGMPLAMILCGQAQGHILPSMQGHLCTPGVINAMLHLTAYLTAFAAIVFALWYFAHHCAHRFFAKPRVPAAPSFFLLRYREFFRLIRTLCDKGRALSLGIIPQRHPTR